MKTENYIAYLEGVVASLLTERTAFHDDEDDVLAYDKNFQPWVVDDKHISYSVYNIKNTLKTRGNPYGDTEDPTEFEDSKRLDYISNHPEHIPYHDNGLWRIPYEISNAGGFGGGIGEFTSKTLRGVIDIARGY